MDPADGSPSLLALKELIPLKPWKTPPPPLSQSRCGYYMKVKDGSRVYWTSKTALHREANDDIIEVEIPYEGLFEFIDKFVVRKVIGDDIVPIQLAHEAQKSALTQRNKDSGPYYAG
ncbi:hypothetical protein TB2_015751 [Malus domestica]